MDHHKQSLMKHSGGSSERTHSNNCALRLPRGTKTRGAGLEASCVNSGKKTWLLWPHSEKLRHNSKVIN